MNAGDCMNAGGRRNAGGCMKKLEWVPCRTWARVGLIFTVLLMPGCVTETTGGLPQPAEDSVRVKAQLDLARAYLEARHFERARAPLSRALAIDSTSVEAHVLLAVLNEAEDDLVSAEEHYKLALRYDADDPQALNNYGSFLYGQERYEESVVVLRKVVLDPNYRVRSQGYENLGLAELKIGELERAKAAFVRSLRLNFNQARSSLELADIAYTAGEFAKAQDFYDSFRTQARQTPRSLCLGMKLAQTNNKTDELASYALALNNLFPESAEAKTCEVPK